MAVYNKSGTALASIYDLSAVSLQYAYDIDGVEIFSGDTPFIPTVLSYDTNWLITSAWLENAETQRNAVRSIYQESEDAIPFFIQTDGHGRYNEGNKGCHNLTESVMEYIPNIMLGDYASYYSDGNNPTNHTASSAGLVNYLPVMGNHEFMKGSAEDATIADLPTLIASYVPSNGILGSQTYGYYKVLDDKYNVKWLVGQPHVPDSNASGGFTTGFTNDQWEWFIDELEADDGYDVIVLNHEPFAGTFYNHTDETTVTYIGHNGKVNLSPILAARKAKTAGTFTDVNGVTHSYDFTGCNSDLLCVFHGHIHRILSADKTEHGYPSYIGTAMMNDGDCAYGIIDRDGGKLHIYPFSKTSVGEPIVLDL